jgi:hypothetical protein
MPKLSMTGGSLLYSNSRYPEDRAPYRPSDTVELLPIPFAALLGRAVALLDLVSPQTAGLSIVGTPYPLNALANLARLTSTLPWVRIGADVEDPNVRVFAE